MFCSLKMPIGAGWESAEEAIVCLGVLEVLQTAQK